MKKGLTLIILLYLIQITQQDCISSLKQQQLILKGNYKKVLHQQSGSVIQGAIFNQGNKGSCLKDDVYTIRDDGVSYTYCLYYTQSIKLKLMQKYLLNTLKIWLWEFDYLNNQQFRYYNLNIFANLNEEKNKIYESEYASSIIKIHFPDQLVQEFQVFNIRGNTHNTALHIIKAEAYYKFS
ncbi:unnamed protein product [Paramecium primaurelia]|uniref:Transmembrane protein n=1 Tax=Paramecium primaurelia TaxID=5886 RepID=A0A8S1QYC4_PARPR|nr:unnamed protein product [Paramecium primaurelia]